jgi:phosphoglycerate kinase
VIGFLIQKELKFLGEAISNPKRPFVAILGGAKVSDKINVIEQLLGKADTLLIGGAMAYTFFLAQGKEVGKSLVERDKVDLAKSLLAKAGGKIKLPVDNVISDKMTDDAVTKIVEGNIPATWKASTSAPRRRALYKAEIAKAKTIIWNGPMGVFEKKPFAAGTKAVAEAVAEATARTARSPSSAAATARRPSSRWAWPTKSATSAPAAGRAGVFGERAFFDAGYCDERRTRVRGAKIHARDAGEGAV